MHRTRKLELEKRRKWVLPHDSFRMTCKLLRHILPKDFTIIRLRQPLTATSETATATAIASPANATFTAYLAVNLKFSYLRAPKATPATEIEGYDVTTAYAPYLGTGSLKAWTNNGMYTNYNNGKDNKTNAADGALINFPFIERWTSNANGGRLPDTSIQQTITELPNGTYFIRGSFIAVNQSTPTTDVTGVTFFAGNQQKSVATDDGIPERYSLRVEVTDGTLTYGLRTRSTTANWIAMDNFSLIYAGTEEEKKQANIKALGKSLPKQTINIIPKIRELDEFLTNHPEYKNRILESHPEIDFARLNGAVVLSRKKEFPGFSERAAILKKYLPGESFSGMWDRAKSLCDRVRNMSGLSSDGTELFQTAFSV